jgi:hypothetical protein
MQLMGAELRPSLFVCASGTLLNMVRVGAYFGCLTRTKIPAADETITNLMSMGFSREEVVAALTACQGNADLAAGVLMGS